MSQTERIKNAGLSSERGTEEVGKGDHVAWKWGPGMAEGVVEEVKESKIEKETKPGVHVTRNGEPGNPALFIHREQGNDVVKKQSEVYKMHDE